MTRNDDLPLWVKAFGSDYYDSEPQKIKLLSLIATANKDLSYHNDVMPRFNILVLEVDGLQYHVDVNLGYLDDGCGADVDTDTLMGYACLTDAEHEWIEDLGPLNEVVEKYTGMGAFDSVVDNFGKLVVSVKAGDTELHNACIELLESQAT